MSHRNSRPIYSKLEDSPVFKYMKKSGVLDPEKEITKPGPWAVANSMVSARDPDPAVQAAIIATNDIKNKRAPRKQGNMSPAVYNYYHTYMNKLTSAYTDESKQGWGKTQKEGFGGEEFGKEAWYNRVFDVLSRPSYVIAGTAKAIREGKRDALGEGLKGLTGKEKTSWSDPKLFNNKWAGLAGDIFLDPTTYLSGGTAATGKVGKFGKLFPAGKAAVKKSDEARKALEEVGRVIGRPDIVAELSAKGTSRTARARQMAVIKEAAAKYGYPIKESEHMPEIIKKMQHIQTELLPDYNIASRRLIKGIFPDLKRLFVNDPEIMAALKKHPYFMVRLAGNGKRFDGTLMDLLDEIAQKATNKGNSSKVFEKFSQALGPELTDEVMDVIRRGTVRDPKFQDDFAKSGYSVRPINLRPSTTGLDPARFMLAGSKSGTDARAFIQRYFAGSQRTKRDLMTLLDDIGQSPYQKAMDNFKANTPNPSDADLADFEKTFGGLSKEPANPIVKEISEALDKMNKVGFDRIDELLKHSSNLDPKLYGVKFAGKMIMPLRESTGKGLTWGLMDKLRKAPLESGDDGNRAQRTLSAMDKYMRPLSSKHPSLYAAQASQQGHIGTLNQATKNRLRLTFKSIPHSRDAAALKSLLTEGKITDAELAPVLRENMKHFLKPLLDHYAQKGIEAGKVEKMNWDDVFKDLNRNLPAKQQLQVQELVTALKKVSRQDLENINYDEFADILTKGLTGSSLAKNSKTLSQALLTMEVASNNLIQSGSFTRGIREFGIPTASDVTGFRSITRNDFEAYTDAQYNLYRKKLNASNLKYHKDDIPGIVKAIHHSDINEMNRNLPGIRNMTRLWKKGKTIYSPSYYSTNMFSDLVANQMNGTINPKHYKQATQIYREVAKAMKNKEFLETLDPSEDIFKQIKNSPDLGLDRVLFKSGKHEITMREAITRYMEDGLGSTSVMEDLGLANVPKGSVTSKFANADNLVLRGANARDNIPRIANYLHSLERALKHPKTGKEDAFHEAADNVRKFNFDYGDFTPFERGLADFMPFYRYQRKAVPHMMRNMMERPTNPDNWMKLQDTASEEIWGDDRNTDQIMPFYLRRGQFMSPMGTRAGDTQYGQVPHPGIDVLKMFGSEANTVPGDQGNNILQAAGGAAMTMGKSFLGLTNPLINTIGGIATKNYPASGRAYPGWQADLKSYFPPAALQATSLIPPVGQYELGKKPGEVGGTSISPISEMNRYESAKQQLGMKGNIPISESILKEIFGRYTEQNTAQKQRMELSKRSAVLDQMLADIARENRTTKSEVSEQSYPWAY